MRLDKEKSKMFKFFESEKFKKIQMIKQKIISNKKTIGVLAISLSISLIISSVPNKETHEPSIYKNEIIEPYTIEGITKQSFEYFEKIEQEKEVFREICEVYNLDFDKTYELASSLTEEFKSEEYLKNNRIPGSTIQGQEPEFNSRELGFLIFVRSLKQLPSNYQITIQEIESKNTYEVTKTPEQIVKQYSELVDLDPYLMLAIMDYESNYFQSNICQNNNNPGGMRDTRRGGFKKFENLEQGIIENILLLKYYPKYQDCQTLERLPELASTYAPLSDGGTNNHWVSSITSIYYELQQQDVFKEKTYTKK